MIAKYKKVFYVLSLLAIIAYAQYFYIQIKESGYNEALVACQNAGIENAQQISLAYAAELDRISQQAAESRNAAIALDNQLNDERERHSDSIKELQKFNYQTCNGHIIINDDWLQRHNANRITTDGDK